MPAATSITPGVLNNEYARQRAISEQLITRLRTSYVGLVVAVSQNGDIAGIGTVDVKPLVAQLDAAGAVIPHATIHGIPYMRLHGGSNAVILDPQVGDIGIVSVCDRDISSVRTNMGEAPPGSLRKHDMSDSVYIATILAANPPKQYVAFQADGIDIVSPGAIRLAARRIVLQASTEIGMTAGAGITNSAPAIALDGEVSQGEGPNGGAATMKGPLTVDGDVVANGISVHNHVHDDPQGGSVSPPR